MLDRTKIERTFYDALADLDLPAHRLFVTAYLIDLDPKKAAKQAGAETKNAATLGARYLRNSKVKQAIELGLLKKQSAHEITAERIEQQLARIAFANLKDVARWQGPEVADGALVHPGGVFPIDSDKMPLDHAAALAEVSMGAHGPSVKLHNQVAALRDLAKIKGMMTDKLHLEGGVGGAGPISINILFQTATPDPSDPLKGARPVEEYETPPEALDG